MDRRNQRLGEAIACYIDLADEFTPIPPFEAGKEPRLEDFDQDFVAKAKKFASEYDLPWPPADIDTAIRLIGERGKDGRLG